MKYTYLCVVFFSFICHAQTDQESTELSFLNSQWSIIRQQKSSKLKTTTLSNLTKIASQLVLNHPNDAKYLIWEAKIYTLAFENSHIFKGIHYAKHAKNSLLEAIKLSSGKQLGYIYSNLGYLYFISPKFSLSLKSKSKKLNYLLKGLQLNPDGLESNYYCGLYFLKKKQSSQIAKNYLNMALTSTETHLDIATMNLLKKEIQTIIESSSKEN